MQLLPKKNYRSIPQSTVLLLWFPAFLKSLSLFLTRRFRGIYPPTTSDRQYGFWSGRSTGDLPAFLIDYVILFWGFQWDICCCLRYIRSFFIESGTELWFHRVLSYHPLFFLLFINDLDLTQCLIHLYTEDYFSTSFSRCSNQKQVNEWNDLGTLFHLHVSHSTHSPVSDLNIWRKM